MEGWIEGVDYYFNEKGLVVFTKKFLLERGSCCGNGCLNCPFDYASVEEPDKTKLLSDRELRRTQK